MKLFRSNFELILGLASVIFLSEAVFSLYSSYTSDTGGVRVRVSLKMKSKKKKKEKKGAKTDEAVTNLQKIEDRKRLTHGPSAAELSHPSKRAEKKWHRYLDRMEDFRELPENELWNTVLFFPEVFPETGNSQTKQLMWYLQQAKVSLKLALYSLNFKMLEHCLVEMAKKKVKVSIVCHWGRPCRLRRRGIQVREMPKLKMSPFGGGLMLDTMHNKFVVIDDVAVMTGSLNWTFPSINENRESFLITNDKRIVPLYETEFQKLWDKADPSKPKEIREAVSEPIKKGLWDCWGLLRTDESDTHCV